MLLGNLPNSPLEWVFAFPAIVLDESMNIFKKFNDWLASKITAGVGTVWCFYIFIAIACISLPAAFASHDPVIMVAWLSSNFLQLILLPVIIVGQNLQSQKDEERADRDDKDIIDIHKKLDKLIKRVK